MIDTSKLLLQLPFWEQLSPVEKQYLQQSAKVQHYSKEAFLGKQQCSCLGLILMVQGEIRAFLISPEGKEVSLFYLQKGEVCVFSASCVLQSITFETALEVKEDCDFLLIPSSSFEKIIKSNLAVRCFSYELAAARFSEVMWVLQQILFVKLDKRLASFLLEESKKQKSFSLKITQEEIAKEISSVREVVTRLLNRFEKDGIVELQRGAIHLNEEKFLKKWGSCVT